MGVPLGKGQWFQGEGCNGMTYSWLQSRMNWAALRASSGLMTDIWLATIPTRKPTHPISYDSCINTGRLTHDVCPRRQNVDTILGLEDGQSRVIDKSQHHLLHVKCLSNIGIYQGKDIIDGISWRKRIRDFTVGLEESLLDLERGDPIPGFVNRIEPEHVSLGYSLGVGH